MIRMQNKGIIIGAGALTAIVIGITVAIAQGTKATDEWMNIRDLIMPQFTTTDLKEKEDIITMEFAPDIDIGFVVEANGLYQYISNNELEIWEVTEEQLYERAMKNLDNKSQNIKVEVAEIAEHDSTARYVIVELEDGFSAVRLLSSGVRKAIAREVGDEYIAAIPTRDFLIFWHKDFPIFDAFAKQVQMEFDAEEEYALTPHLFRVNKYGIQQVKVVKNEEDTL